MQTGIEPAHNDLSSFSLATILALSLLQFLNQLLNNFNLNFNIDMVSYFKVSVLLTLKPSVAPSY